MDLLQNPFHILNATPRDNHRKIMELAEERSLLLESNQCIEARSDLTNPRKRLSMEIAWLPGLGPKRVTEVLSVLENSVQDLFGMDKLTPIARANLLAAGLSRLSGSSPYDVVQWIIELTSTFEKIDPKELCTLINEERIVSGFPEVTDLALLEAEIQERRRQYCQVIKSALDNFSIEELVKAVTIVVDSAMFLVPRPILIDDLVDYYEVKTQALLENEVQNIEALVEELKIAADDKRPDSILSTLVDRLIQEVKNWGILAKPIQVSTKSRGLDHGDSRRLAGLVRGVGIHLFIEHGKLNFSQQLTNMLQEVFAEVVEVAERTAEDLTALSNIAEQQRLSELLDPISERCKKARENAENNPSLGDRYAHSLIHDVTQLFSKLSMDNVPAEILSKYNDEIALTLMHCAIVYANKTDKWKPCILVLNEALKYASSNDVRDHIEKNLITVRNNDRLLGDLSPVPSAPSLYTLNGIGFTLYGSTEPDPETNSHLSTYYFVFFWIPIFPICRYRVIPTEGGYRFLGKAPLRVFDKLHLFFSLAVIAFFAISIILESTQSPKYQSSPSSYSTGRSVPSQPYSNRSSYTRSTLAREIEYGKTRAKQMETQIKDMDDRLNDYERRLNLYRASGMKDEYNMLVPSFNSLVRERNNLYEEYRRLIDDVNSKVTRYNLGAR